MVIFFSDMKIETKNEEPLIVHNNTAIVLITPSLKDRDFNGVLEVKNNSIQLGSL